SRRVANYGGLVLSSAYLLFTIGNKLYVDQVFADALEAEDTSVRQVLTKPTPFNNLLWTGIAETKDEFYVGHYSLLDDTKRIDFQRVPKRHDLLGDARESREVQRIQWFSRGYYAVRKTSDGGLRVVDLRFGRSDLGLTDQGAYIFSFKLETDADGRVTGIRRESPEVRFSTDLLGRFVDRIRGIESTGVLQTKTPLRSR
ncbi:MAG: metal-dependent hydrolase, partial [Salinivenus sp.]